VYGECRGETTAHPLEKHCTLKSCGNCCWALQRKRRKGGCNLHKKPPCPGVHVLLRIPNKSSKDLKVIFPND